MDEITVLLKPILDTVSPDQPVTLLHDWGRVFGYELAARHAERIARIVALDIGDARSPEFLRTPPLKHKLMIVFYQVWLAECWVLVCAALRTSSHIAPCSTSAASPNPSCSIHSNG